MRPGLRILPLFEGPPGNYKTALLRYHPGTSLPAHVHMGDEHIYILAGAQEDESGLYGAGAYVHNPTGTSHRVWSEEGCLALIHWRAPVRFL
jgi:anti-sigma factor ChrR (cupin superfamily)